MNLKLISVGKCKEAYLRDAVAEYQKRLSKFVKVELIEVPDEKTQENASEKENDRVKMLEGKRILEKVNERDYVIALAIKGTMFTSEEMSKRISDLMNESKSDLAVIIGGSLGLSEEVLSRANEKWSFSKLTFPHQLMRVIALEQLYRSFKIMHGEPYHK